MNDRFASDGATNTARLAALGLGLPPVPAPASAAYVPAVRHGDLVLVSGQLPFADGALLATGLVGDGAGEQDVPSATALAQRCALNVLAAAAAVAGGLDAITSVLHVRVFVASGEGFTGQHLVANGASDLFAAVLGPGAVHARAAVGVLRLPLDAPLEIEATLAVALPA